MSGRQTIPGAKAPVPKKKSAKAKAEAKEAKKAKKPSKPKGTGKIDIGVLRPVFFTLKVQITIAEAEAICSKIYLINGIPLPSASMKTFRLSREVNK